MPINSLDWPTYYCDTGCKWSAKCTECPLEKCTCEMTDKERGKLISAGMKREGKGG